MSAPVWTAEMIYAPVELASDRCPMPPQATRGLPAALREDEDSSLWEYTEQYLTAIEHETKWCWVENPEVWTERNFEEDIVKAFLLWPHKNCPICQGTLRVSLPIVGLITGVPCSQRIWCPCVRIKSIESQLRDSRLISPKHAHASLETLRPDRRSLLDEQRQQDYIDLLRARPKANYFFFGDSGTGKTHFVTALVRDAIVRTAEWCERKREPYHQAVFRAPVVELLDQMHAQTTRDWENKGPVCKPVVEIEGLRKLLKQGYPVTVVLEELDKFLPTESRQNNLFKLVDALYEGNAQLVMTSNRGPDELLAKWGEIEGQTILRRICDWSQEGGRLGFLLHFPASRKFTLGSTDAAKALERIRRQAE